MSDSIRLRGEQLEWREVDGEVLILDLSTSTYLAVNRTGAVLWEDLLKGSTHERLVSRLAEQFGIDEDTAVRDLDAFLSDFRERELLVDSASG